MTTLPPKLPISTLAALQAWVAADTGHTEPQRRERHSAINLIAKAAGKATNYLPAAPAELKSVLNDASVPTRLEITLRRWQNAKSLYRSTAKRYGVVKTNSRQLSHDWLGLHTALPSNREKTGLSRFCRYCSTRDIAPADVSDSIMDGFAQYLLNETTVAKPGQLHRRAIRLWNEVAATNVGEQLHELHLEPRQNRYQIPESEWPEALLVDTNQFFDWTSGNDFCKDSPPSGPWSINTAKTNRRYVHALVSAAHRGGVPWSELQALSGLVQAPARQAIATFFMKHSDGDPTPYLHSLCTALFYIAKNWANADPEALKKIKQLRRRMGVTQQNLTHKNRKLISETKSSAVQRSLLMLPEKLMAQARAMKDPRRAAVKAQMATAVLLLTRAPMRSGNLVMLNIKKHFSGVGDTKQRISIHIPEGEVKNHIPLSYELNEATSTLLRQYLRDFQPTLDPNRTNYLMPGAGTTHKHQRTLGQQLSELTEVELGIRITPHQFRHIAANQILDANPGAFAVVQQLLGHRNLITTTRNYAGQDMARASRLFDSIIESTLKADGETNE